MAIGRLVGGDDGARQFLLLAESSGVAICFGGYCGDFEFWLEEEMSRDYVYIAQGCADARDIEFKSIPVGIQVCPSCEGNGKRVQRYLEGRMTGPCDFCSATAFVYMDTARPVPTSVTNQIAVANGLEFRRFEAHGIDWRTPQVTSDGVQ